jgi:hypothetical protein
MAVPFRAVCAVALACSVAGCVATRPSPAPERPDRMVSLRGDSEPFQRLGRKAFPQPKASCLEAVVRTFKNIGLGTEKADLESGVAVSGKATVHRAAVALSGGGTVVQRTEDTKIYVRVTGSETTCDVDVRKLRLWRDTVELENGRESWLATQLRSFMIGVEQELAEAQ